MEATGTAFLRKAAPDWNLAGDKYLLGLLEQMHQNIITKCQEVNTSLDKMVTTLDNANIDLQNVNNKFMSLSNRQFVESRVYDDDVDVLEEAADQKEPPKVVEPENVALKLKHSLQRLEELHETVRILDSDSSDEEDEGQLVLKLRDVYRPRPLPHIIGSHAWTTKWHVGLVASGSDSDSESSYKREGAPSEQYSDSDDNSAEHTAQPTISSGSEICSEASPQVARPADIAAEIAKRLGGHPAELPEPDLSGPEPTPRTLYTAAPPLPATIFFDEPPPLDQTEQDVYSEEDDIFAELHKKPYPKSNKDQNSNITSRNIVDDLFGDDEFYDNDDKVQNREVTEPNKNSDVKSSMMKNDFEPPPIIQGKAETNHEDLPREKLSPADGSKKPIGGISLFGTNQGAESIGAAILKRNLRKSSTDEENEETTTTNRTIDKPVDKQDGSNSDVIKNLFIKPKPVKKEFVGIKKEIVTKKEDIPKEKPRERIDLFNDNLFDDIDDIFTSSIVTKPKEQTKKSLFDDDDLFSDLTVKTETKSEKKVKSIFDSDDELFSDNLTKAVPKDEETKKNKIINDKNDKVTSKHKSVFDDSDDELFSTENSIPSESFKSQVNSNISQLPTDERSVASATKMQDKSDITLKDTIDKCGNNVNIKKSNALFNDSDEDTFETTKIGERDDKQQNTSNSKENTLVSLIDKKQINEKIIVQTGSIFAGDSDDDLFSDVSENKIPSKVINNLSKNEFVKNENLDKEENKLKEQNRTNENIVTENGIKSSNSFQSASVFEDDESDDVNNDKTQLLNQSNHGNDMSQLEKKTSKGEINIGPNTAGNTGIEIRSSKDDIPVHINLFNKSEISDSDKITQINQEQKENIQDNIIKTDNVNDACISNILPTKQDVFDDIFSDLPPEFEKPTEPKKSKNVNALFDDDSDDEALFFKKNDIISDDKPDLNFGEERFKIFNDEPPDIDFDFTQKIGTQEVEQQKHLDDKINVKSKSCTDIGQTDAQTQNQKLQNIDIANFENENKLNIVDNDKISTLNKIEPDLRGESVLPKDYSPKNKNKIIDSDNEAIDFPDVDSKKIVGKLKPTNLNIDVNSLLPGAVKRVKMRDEIDNQKLSTQSNEELNKQSENPESKMVKSISFDNSESAILDNKLSKERARIKIKRRPSSRRARLEAARKSGIDFGDYTPDTSSFDESDLKSQVINKKSFTENIGTSNIIQNDTLTNVLNTTSATNTINKTITNLPDVLERTQKVDSEGLCKNNDKIDFSKEEDFSDMFNTIREDKTLDKQNTDEVNSFHSDNKLTSSISTMSSSHKETETIINILNEEIANEDLGNKVFPKTEYIVQNQSSAVSSEISSSISSTTNIKETSNKNVTSKVVYILNDEDIFNTKDNTDINTRDDKFGPTKKVLNIVDDDEELFRNPQKVSTLGNTYKDSIQTIKLNKESVKSKSIFDDESDDDDLFKGKNRKSEKVQKNVKNAGQKDTKILKKGKKETKNVSIFGDESDEDLFTSKPSTSTDSHKVFKPREVTKITSDPVMEDPLSLLTDDS